MPGIFTSLITSANTLGVYERMFETVGNNINNASSPGYAKQRMSPQPMAFDPASGLAGGISAGDLESSRNEYAETAVRSNLSSWGNSDQRASQLTSIEPLFDVTGDAGIPAALSQLSKDFSSWSVAPNDGIARQSVLDSAGVVAQRFNQAATGLSNASNALNGNIQNATDTINNLTGQIASINSEIQHSLSGNNPATDTEMHNALDSLSEYADFVALKQPDGTFMVLLGGQTLLVDGQTSYKIGIDTSTPTTAILDTNGQDVTNQLSDGRLKALVDLQSNVIPGFSAALSQLAAGVSDGINGVLAAGVDQSGAPGAPLFQYNAPEDAAFSMQVTSIAPDQLAAATPAAPGGNTNALALVSLFNAPQINGMTFIQAYGSLASQVGQAVQQAKNNQSTQNDLLIQARAMRSTISDVSLDEEATRLMTYQRAYEATAKLVTTLDSLTQTTINMFR
jgi:flagellar hook-associated protein 1 FlgK